MVTTRGPAPSQLVTFTADGSFLLSAAPVFPVPPEAGVGVTRVFGSGGHGTWIQTGERRFAARFVSLLFDEEANLIAIFTSESTITISPDEDSLSVLARHEFRAPDGTLIDAGEGPAQGTRIRVDQ